MNRKTWTGWGMAGAIASVLAVGCHPKPDASQSIAWKTSYDAALADAGATGRPILLDFYTDW